MHTRNQKYVGGRVMVFVVCLQLAAAFNAWLSSDSNVNGNVASITSNHLQQLGHFVCGATPTQISGISTSAYR